MTSAILIDHAPEMGAVPVIAVRPDGLADCLGGLDAPSAAFARRSGFAAAAGAIAVLPDETGAVAAVLFGLGAQDAGEDRLIAGRLATGLPPGAYSLHSGFPDPALAALAFCLGAYRFDLYRKGKEADVRLVTPAGVDAAELRRVADAVCLARDLINTPANDMGPADLETAIRAVGDAHGATVSVTTGQALLDQNFPLIHSVGAAAAEGREPRLVDLVWGEPSAPRVTLVGKGVCFDTGGLDIKPSSNMILMKKDMGGAANALALAAMIMGAGLPVRLRLLVPAVENAISGAAFRPGDILPSRKGLSVEIGNTDAEGRLVLADALTLASEETPELLLDFATLTGAARVALGPDLPAVFTRDDALAAELSASAEATADPLWRLPLWSPYLKMIETRIADINNAGKGGFAGAITAALFLERFVGAGISWLHTDLYGWNPTARPASPEGGEAHAIRAAYALLKDRYPKT